MVTEFGLGRKIVSVPDFGMQVMQPAAVAADWWDPNDEGLSVVAAYRAINSVGTPWPGGPTVYAESLVNQANPGVNDLIEGNKAVPWAAATGWGFVAEALQYFDTGVVSIPDGTWTAFIQYTDHVMAAVAYLFGAQSNALLAGFSLRTVLPDRMFCYNGDLSASSNIPEMTDGNYGFSGKQPYRDGNPEPNLIPAGVGGAMALSVYIGAVNLNGAAANYVTMNARAFVIYDGILTDPQALSIATAMGQL